MKLQSKKDFQLNLNSTTDLLFKYNIILGNEAYSHSLVSHSSEDNVKRSFPVKNIRYCFPPLPCRCGVHFLCILSFLQTAFHALRFALTTDFPFLLCSGDVCQSTGPAKKWNKKSKQHLRFCTMLFRL